MPKVLGDWLIEENDRLRAELAAETKTRKAYADEWPRLVAERDALRAELAARDELLRYVRKWKTSGDAELATRIDAALEKGGGNGKSES